MTIVKFLAALLAIVGVAASSAIADEIALITITSDEEAAIAASVVGRAHGRVGEHFIVVLEEGQGALLGKSGIDFEIVMSDVDGSRCHLVIMEGPRLDRRPDISGLVEICPGVWLVPPGVTAESGARWKVIELSRLNTPLTYVRDQSYALVSTIEEYPTDTIVAKVSLDSIYAFVTRLEAFQTRFITTDSIDAARDWLVQKFLDWGYQDVTTPQFDYDGEVHYNVMAVKPGYAEPDEVIVVGAHYDATNFDMEPGSWEPIQEIYAPGADDNASGVATVLEMARTLKDIPLRKTIIFMAFSAEEVGLVGSLAAVDDFIQDGTDIEVMYNYDMVAYDPIDLQYVYLWSGPSPAYSQVLYSATKRVTNLTPVISTDNLLNTSDQFSFYSNGFQAGRLREYIFNYDGWHTNLDISSRLNFEYLTEVIRVALSGLAVVASSVAPTPIDQVVDVGDGQSLQVEWTDCNLEYQYTVRYGTRSGQYDFSVSVPPDQCFCLLEGLEEGVRYYVTLVGEVAGAYPQIYAEEACGTPYLIPRPPQNLCTEPHPYAVSLDWDDNREADFSHYRLYRDEGNGLELLVDDISESWYSDSGVVSLIDYVYHVAAVDFDGYESELSGGAIGYAYTFDQGVGIIDETADDAYLPSQSEQEAFFASVFAGARFSVNPVAGLLDTLTYRDAGSFSSIFWIDDDLGHKDIAYSEGGLEWCLGYPVNIFIAGWQTVTRWTDARIEREHLLRREFGLRTYSQNDVNDFVGANGQNSWPSVEVRADNLWQGRLPYIPAFGRWKGAEIIYTYDSFSDNPDFEGRPCGLLYQTENGKRIVLAFPIWWLAESSAQALISKALEEFGEIPVSLFGDLDGSGRVDILDLDLAARELYRKEQTQTTENTVHRENPLYKSNADHLVEYLFPQGKSDQPQVR